MVSELLFQIVRFEPKDFGQLLPDGRFIGVEVKSKTGRQSPVQKQMEQEIRRRNGIYMLARTIDDVEEALASARAPITARAMYDRSIRLVVPCDAQPS